MSQVTLLTVLSDFDRLHRLADSGKRSVSIECDILTRLLVDHTRLTTACKAAGIKITEPVPPRQRAHLK